MTRAEGGEVHLWSMRTSFAVPGASPVEVIGSYRRAEADDVGDGGTRQAARRIGVFAQTEILAVGTRAL